MQRLHVSKYDTILNYKQNDIIKKKCKEGTVGIFHSNVWSWINLLSVPDPTELQWCNQKSGPSLFLSENFCRILLFKKKKCRIFVVP